MAWLKTQIDVGIVPIGKEKIVSFYADSDMNVRSLIPSCGCTKVDYSEKNKVLTVKLTPDPLPEHLREVGEYIISKTITVTYRDDKPNEVLTFKGIARNE